MRESFSAWKQTVGEVLRIMAILTPMLVGALAWARSLDEKVTVLKERQDMVLDRWEHQETLNKEMVKTLQELQVTIAGMK